MLLILTLIDIKRQLLPIIPSINGNKMVFLFFWTEFDTNMVPPEYVKFYANFNNFPSLRKKSVDTDVINLLNE